jgi:hypothetical protein
LTTAMTEMGQVPKVRAAASYKKPNIIAVAGYSRVVSLDEVDPHPP